MNTTSAIRWGGLRMVAKQLQYSSYLLRLWQTSSQGHLIWRASLEDPHTGQRLGFTDVERLIAFLKEETGRDRRQTTDAGR